MPNMNALALWREQARVMLLFCLKPLFDKARVI